MWEFPREDAPVAVTQWLGESWSEPVITKIKLAVDGGPAHERWVAIFGGGFDRSGDPNGSFYDLQATAGRSITILDLKNGEILAQKRFDPTGVPAGDDPTVVTYDPANPERSMVFAIASTPGVYDLDDDGYADTVYVGDLGGNVWKWVIHDPGDDIINGSTGNADQAAWHFEKWFAAPVHTHSVTGVKHYRSFYFYPSATVKSGVLWLAFGSGERADLKFAGYPTPQDENNRFYAVKDVDPFEKGASAPVLGESTLFDMTATLGGDNSTSVSSFDGLMFKGADGEKFVTATDIFFYYVFVASFTPTTGGDPCSTGGDATLYAFKIYSGEGLFEDASGNPVATIDLGDGLPTNPEVSLSGSSGGSRVFVNKKDEVISLDTGFTLDLPSGVATWEEVY
jgi:type IV pilus assembly protein PilY1